MPIRAVWFDVGEVLIYETREYHAWADWLGVPRHTFSAVLGALIARGEDYRQTFQHFRPDFDLDEDRQARLDAGLGEYSNADDLYPAARPCLEARKQAGYFVGIAGNQTTRAGQTQPSVRHRRTGSVQVRRSPARARWRHPTPVAPARPFCARCTI